jgi:hypothetical protein
MGSSSSIVYFIALLSVGWAQVFNPLYTSTQLSPARTLPLDLSHILDNRGFGESPGDADFDGSQSKEKTKHYSWEYTQVDNI